MKLEWRRCTDPIFGEGLYLTGLPAYTGALTRVENVARAYYSRNSKPPYVATGWINGRFLLHRAGTLRAAVSRLNRELDRRSIGLFGIDELEITAP